jgi:hypothetical protein
LIVCATKNHEGTILSFQTLVDMGTLRSAYALLNRKASSDCILPNDEDSYIAALSSLVEAIVLSDEVVVPGVPHMHGEIVASLFGEAIKYRPIDQALYCEIEREAIDWALNNVDASQAIDAMNVELRAGPGGNSDVYRVETTFGFCRKGQKLDLAICGSAQTGLECRNEAPYGLDVKSELSARGAQREAEMRNLMEKWPNDRRVGYTPTTFLYWVLVRCRCYDSIARLWKLPYAPHPLRARATLLSRSSDDTAKSGGNPYMAAIKAVLNEGRTYINSETGSVVAPLEYSPILPFILANCQHKSEVLPRAYELRDAPGPRACRKRLAQYFEALNCGAIRDLTKLSGEIATLKNYLRAELGVPVSGEPITIGMYAASVPIPHRLTTLVKGFAASFREPQTLFVRNVFNEIGAVAKLGGKYEMLTRGPDAMLGHQVSWSKAEVARNLAYQFNMDIAAGTPSIERKANGIGLARRLVPSLSFADAWKLVQQVVAEHSNTAVKPQ